MKMELIDRYIYAVVQNLPESQRMDIKKELKGLIEDMLDDRLQGREATQTDVEMVLIELGAPAVLADRYRGSKRYLIGPEIFSTYLTILKIVCMAVGLAMFIVFTIQSVFTPTQILSHFLNLLGGLAMSLIQAFAWVTLIFGIMEYTGVQKGKLAKDEEWKPSDLPPLPQDEIRIKRADPIAGIVFTVLFMMLLTFSTNLFGVWIIDGSRPAVVIPFLNEGVFRSFLPYIWVMAAVNILNEILQLLKGRWTLPLAAADVLVHILNFVLLVFMFSGRAIWNPDFIQQMAQAGLAPHNGESYQVITRVWEQATNGFIYLAGAIFLLEMGSMAVKIYRMRKEIGITPAVESAQ